MSGHCVHGCFGASAAFHPHPADSLSFLSITACSYFEANMNFCSKLCKMQTSVDLAVQEINTLHSLCTDGASETRFVVVVKINWCSKITSVNVLSVHNVLTLVLFLSALSSEISSSFSSSCSRQAFSSLVSAANS